MDDSLSIRHHFTSGAAMRVTLFSTKSYDRRFFEQANQAVGHELTFLEPRLDRQTVALAAGAEAVCVFVNDCLDADVLAELRGLGVRLVALRCAGFNNVDLPAAERLGIRVVRVPAYSPYAVAEHTLALILTLNRKLHRAHNRVRESNFALEGLLGFDIHGLTAGIVGTGKIGAIVCRLLAGFGCRILAYDPYPNPDCVANGVEYVDLPQLLAESHIVSLHCPLTSENRHLISADAIASMRDNVMLINTSRGGLVDTREVINGLKSRKIGYVGLDVYEEEASLFFEDHSSQILQDDVFARLTTFPNVIVTAHQAFFTSDALGNIAETTLANISDIAHDRPCPNLVAASR